MNDFSLDSFLTVLQYLLKQILILTLFKPAQKHRLIYHCNSYLGDAVESRPHQLHVSYFVNHSLPISSTAPHLNHEL